MSLEDRAGPAAFEALVKNLQEESWEPVGSYGSEWWEQRLRRKNL